MHEPIIEAHSLSKRYRIGAPPKEANNAIQAIKNACLAPFAYLRKATSKGSEAEWIWALKNASFSINRGEAVGIVGRNGAGKTTLLKILSRITDPTNGKAIIKGRVGSLLEVGTGFHPELTGRENLYLNGAIIGMKKAEVKAKFDEIVAFAEVAKFIDTPVKYYSSGMYVRLAFAVAAHLEPEVLLVDEVLAVGDAAFQKKCLGKMDDVTHQGRTVLLVSHNMEAVLGLCERAIWIDNGEIIEDGLARNVVHNYVRISLEQSEQRNLLTETDRIGNGRVRFTGVSLRDKDGNSASSAVCGEPVDLLLSYATNGEEVSQVSVRVWIRDYSGKERICLWTKAKGQYFDSLPPKGYFVCRIPRISLVPGAYSLDIIADTGREKADKIFNAAKLEVAPGDFFGSGLKVGRLGEYLCDHEWLIEST